MPVLHQVVQGECLSSIAHKYGFANWRTIYDAPANADFRRQRPNPNLIYPGDQIAIPDKDGGGLSLPLGILNTIVVQLTQSKLKLLLVDASLQPLSNANYVLEVAAARFSGTVTGGKVEHDVPPDATEGRLRVEMKPGDAGSAVEYTLKIGHLDPVGYASGLQARLRNLGYYAGPITGTLDAATTSAWVDFKRRNRLGDSAEVDRKSLSTLEQQHEPESQSGLVDDVNHAEQTNA